METVVFGYDKQTKTRFGLVSVREDDMRLLFKGKPVTPAIEANSSLSIVAHYEDRPQRRAAAAKLRRHRLPSSVSLHHRECCGLARYAGVWDLFGHYLSDF